MTESLPFTSDELKAARRWRQQANLVLAGVYHFDRLLAAVADANQRAERAEAERDALQAMVDGCRELVGDYHSQLTPGSGPVSHGLHRELAEVVGYPWGWRALVADQPEAPRRITGEPPGWEGTRATFERSISGLVADQPEHEGPQRRRRYVHPDPATQAQQVAADALVADQPQEEIDG